MKCDSCMHSRTIVSENGFHPICCLPDIDVKECLKSGKHYFQHPKFKISKEEHRMTNAEHIRSMNDEDLAKFLCCLNHECYECPADDLCAGGLNGMLVWLRQGVEDVT